MPSGDCSTVKFIPISYIGSGSTYTFEEFCKFFREQNEKMDDGKMFSVVCEEEGAIL